jgi:hypothetical protein
MYLVLIFVPKKDKRNTYRKIVTKRMIKPGFGKIYIYS